MRSSSEKPRWRIPMSKKTNPKQKSKDAPERVTSRNETETTAVDRGTRSRTRNDCLRDPLVRPKWEHWPATRSLHRVLVAESTMVLSARPGRAGDLPPVG